MNGGASTPVLEPRAWGELLALSGDETSDRLFLERLLEAWGQARGAESVALYSRIKTGALEQEACIGKPLPAHLAPEAEAGATPAGTGRLLLPGGLLLFAPAHILSPAEAGSGSDPVTLLLATALKGCRLKREIKEQQFQVNYRLVEMEALYDVGLAVAATLNLDRLSEEILMRAVSLLDARRGALYILETATPGHAGHAGHAGQYRLAGTFGGEAAPAFSLENLDLAAFLEGGAPAPDDLLPGARHVMGVPIEIDSTPRGLLAVGDKESRKGVGPFLAADRRTLALFANQAAIALENARLHLEALEKERLEREMHVAAEIQRQILPKGAPHVPGYDIVGWNRPARQVGGDYYDFFVKGEDRVGLVVGDVSGKGIPAALLVSTLHSALSLMLDQTGFGPSLLERLNSHILESSLSNKFITMLLAQLDPRTGDLAYINAGHNPGLVLRREGAVEELGSTGLPIGLLAASRFQARTLNVEAGDLVCLYSDGITECESADAEEFGVARLVEQMRGHAGRPLDAVLEDIQQSLAQYSAGLPQGDDQTLVLLRRT